MSLSYPSPFAAGAAAPSPAASLCPPFSIPVPVAPFKAVAEQEGGREDAEKDEDEDEEKEETLPEGKKRFMRKSRK
eukprot:evm.model.NODE_17468_length_18357_cov_25.986654.1